MNVCVVAPIEEKVPPVEYGGIGRIVNNLVVGLMERGHRVDVVGPGDSTIKATVVPVVEKALGVASIYPNNRSNREAYYYNVVGKIITEISKRHYDIISNHFGWRLVPFRGLTGAPLITTLHTPLGEQNKKIIYSAHKGAYYVSSCARQRLPLPDLNYLATIYHGIDASKYFFHNRRGNNLVFVGRMSPEKGPLEAISIAREIGKKLVMAAAVHEWDRNYFESVIKPHIDGENVVFLGEINDAEKNKLFEGALALLAPIQWEEPFGFVFLEALACGVPVLTLNRGSANEIVEDGITGIVANSVPELVLRFPEIEKISRSECRKSVETKFSIQRMAKAYEDIFKKALFDTTTR